jgi:caa(3)-type oxidase subunit IV
MSDHNQNNYGKQGDKHHVSDDAGHHHILSNKIAYQIWGILITLTLITVGVAQIDLGAWNFAVAMVVATIKATLVCMFFMGLKYDHRENTVIFCTSFIFMSIFGILTFGDLLTRGDVYVKGSILPPPTGMVKSKFKNPWIATPEMVAHGHEQFLAQCVTCHGPLGLGNGPASAALNPKPRNFTSADNWKNGRKPSQIFGTLTKGLNAMPSFGSLPSDDRWSLVAYVRTLGPHAGEVDSPADLAKIGIDPTKGDAGGGEKIVPIDVAMDDMSDAASAAPAHK